MRRRPRQEVIVVEDPLCAECAHRVTEHGMFGCLHLSDDNEELPFCICLRSRVSLEAMIEADTQTA